MLFKVMSNGQLSIIIYFGCNLRIFFEFEF